MVTVLGIRHHGVGSAARVKERLVELQPDLVLIEGPPEIDPLLPFIGTSELTPPVAIMLYDEKDTSASTFYPYASYSPEWVAADYANTHNVPVRSIDLPSQVSLHTYFPKGEKPILKTKIEETQDTTERSEPSYSRHPMAYLAEAAGYANSDEWWEYMFERTPEGTSATDHFEAVAMSIAALRDEKLASSLDAENIYREAYMRQLIRAAKNEMYTNIVVICGAWHAPALLALDTTEKQDAKLLKQLPKSRSKIKASWIPWTNGRLSLHSGYGAGINSPGWYEHLWTTPADIETTWLRKVAAVFRSEGQDISTAHILESYKLTRALCQLRGKQHIGLSELNEATLTVMCMGDGILLELLKKDLIVGEKIGLVPDDIPKVPLQEDFERTIKSLRLSLSASPKEYHLDLRKANDLKRSVLFHRLSILQIQWAVSIASRTKGTFKESWTLQWQPDMMLGLVDNAYLGNTVYDAATKKVESTVAESTKISVLTALLGRVLPAELPSSIELILAQIDTLSSISADVVDLMQAIPQLVNVQRYGDVRNSDLSLLTEIVERLLIKVFINLPAACYGLNEEKSNELFQLISELQTVLKIYDDSVLLAQWQDTLQLMSTKENIHHIIQGCVCRLLLDAGLLEPDEATRRMAYALSPGHEARDVASWVEGFLRGSGMILIYDNRLWNLLYDWLLTLDKESFTDLLPYLRRAFSKFEYGERQQIGSKAKKGNAVDKRVVADRGFDEELTRGVLETIDLLVGIKK